MTFTIKTRNIRVIGHGVGTAVIVWKTIKHFQLPEYRKYHIHAISINISESESTIIIISILFLQAF